eukprot:Gb_08980 [translate_table: standard]
MATRSFWATNAVEGNLDLYAQEWEQFLTEDTDEQHNSELLMLIQSGVVDYAMAPTLHLPYPITVEILWQFEDNALWFPDKVIRAIEELIHRITVSPYMAQHHYWSVNKEHFCEQPFTMAWSRPDLPTIPLPKVRKEKEALGKDKKKKSTPIDSATRKWKHLEEDLDQGKYDYRLCKNSSICEPHQYDSSYFTTSYHPGSSLYMEPRVAGIDPNLDAAFDIVPPPSLQRVREKRKGQFTPKVQALDNTLTTQSAKDLISWTAKELATRAEELELELAQQAHHAHEENEALDLNLKILTKEISRQGTLLGT